MLNTGIKLGPYEILDRLGVGGMGEVYRARDARLDRTVAVKVLPPASMRNAERVQRFEQEARAASARNHPNILTIYDFGIAEGTHYMATEYVEGQTLRQLISTGPMPVVKALDIAMQCAGGLAAAHAAGIIHRDIKPANIMVRPDGYVKILDFGLAKLAEPALPASDPNAPTVDRGALTEPGRILGTWLYMSPEQARGQEVDARTDIWSLGAVLYEMVTGKSPFTARSLGDTIAAILNQEPSAMAESVPSAPAELERIVAKALTKDREERYQSIKDMAGDLRQLKAQLEMEKLTGSVHAPPAARRSATAVPVKRGSRLLQVTAIAAAVAFLLILWKLGAMRPTAGSKQPAVSQAAAGNGTSAAQARRQLTFSLRVQKMRNGRAYQEPFLSTGREIFENGWKFQFVFAPQQPGALYVLNDGPGPQGNVLRVLFPTPQVNDGVSSVLPAAKLESEWLNLDEHPGVEKVWLIWAAAPVEELETIIRQAVTQNAGAIRDQQPSERVRALLAQYAASTVALREDKALKQSTLEGPGQVLAALLELEHH